MPTPKGFKITGLLAYKQLEKESCQILFDYLDNAPPIQPPIEIGFLLLGGKIAENKYLPSAYPHRGAKVLVQIDATVKGNICFRFCIGGRFFRLFKFL